MFRDECPISGYEAKPTPELRITGAHTHTHTHTHTDRYTHTRNGWCPECSAALTELWNLDRRHWIRSKGRK